LECLNTTFDNNSIQDPQKWIRLHENYDIDVIFLVNVRAVKEGEARLAEYLKAETAKKKP